MSTHQVQLHKRDNPAGSLEIISSVGTWLAVVVACVALLGVIAPWLAIKAAQSEKNRALNLVYDRQNHYITRGRRVPGTRLRLFRRIRLPNLAPALDAGSPEIVPLIGPAVLAQAWILQGPQFNNWNNGWTKLCALLEAHHVPDNDVPIRVTTGLSRVGRVEVINSQTAMAASRFWVLAVGLLGRYTARTRYLLMAGGSAEEDWGNFGAPRQHPPTAQHAVAVAATPSVGSMASSYASHDISTSTWETGSESNDIIMSSTMGDTPGILWDTSHATPSGPQQLSQNRYGMWELTTARLPEINGFTGCFKNLGWHRTDAALRNILTFYPQSLSEVCGLATKQHSLSILDLFWLANGFFPLKRGEDNDREIYKLISYRPADYFKTAKHLFSRSQLPMPSGTSLKLAQVNFKSLPPRITKPALAFGFRPGCTLWQWEVAALSDDAQTVSPMAQNYSAMLGFHPQHQHGGPNAGQDDNIMWEAKDFARITRAFLGLDMDAWGYLISHVQLPQWRAIMEVNSWDLSVLSIRYNNTIGPHLRNILAQTQGAQANVFQPEWLRHGLSFGDLFGGFHPPTSADFTLLESLLLASISKSSKALIVPIGYIWMTNAAFRDDILSDMLFIYQDEAPMGTPLERRQNAEAAFVSMVKYLRYSQPTLMERYSGDVNATAGLQTMAEADESRHRYLTNRGKGFRIDEVRYDKSRMALTWEVTERDIPFPIVQPREVQLPASQNAVEGAADEVAISSTDVASLCIVLMLRCAAFLMAENSHCLLKFVNNLDGHVWVI